MPRLRPALPLALALAVAATALAAAPGATSALRTEIEGRLAAGGLPPKRTEVLESVAADLADDATLLDEARSARRSAQRLGATFPRDAALRRLLRGAAGAVAGELDRDRAALAGALPDLGAPAAGIVRRGLRDVATSMGRAERSRRATPRLAFLAKACAALEDARTRSGAVPVAGPAPQPDFSLTDVNPASPTRGRAVSPRARLGKVSAWYFGSST
jgi:hypothetical protein